MRSNRTNLRDIDSLLVRGIKAAMVEMRSSGYLSAVQEDAILEVLSWSEWREQAILAEAESVKATEDE